MVKKITLIGTLPPIKGISDTCLNQVKYLTKDVFVDFIGFKSIYPEFLYPGSTKENSKSFQIESLSDLNIRNILTWYNPFSWIWAGISAKGKIVHFHWWTFVLFPVFFVILLVAKIRRKILVCEAHNILGHESNSIDKFLNKIIFKLSDYFIVHSEQNKQQLKKFFNVDNKKINVIPLGALDFFADDVVSKFQARKVLKIPVNSKIVLCFGNIRRYKGIDILIKAFSGVKKQIPETKLLIAGKNWIDWQFFQRLIEESNLKDSVITNLDFIPTSKVKYYFMASDLVVLPYLKFEAQSGPGRIALAFGKALVVTKVGGLSDLVKEDSVVVESGNVNQLTQAIINVLKDDNFRKKLENDSKELAQKYSWDTIAKKTIILYRRLI